MMGWTTSASRFLVPEEMEVVVRDGEYADTLRWRGHASLAEERAGVCDIEATVPGYLPWDTSGVVVRQDGCHVQSAEITARMQPAESD